jgi:hypothetical protein
MYELREFLKSIEGTSYSFLPIEFLDSDRNRCNFHTELSFPNYRYRFRFRSYRFRSCFRGKI